MKYRPCSSNPVTWKILMTSWTSLSWKPNGATARTRFEWQWKSYCAPSSSTALMYGSHRVPSRSCARPPCSSLPYHDRLSWMMVANGRMYGRHDHSLSCVDRCVACSWRVRDAQKRSRGLCLFQRLRSPFLCRVSTGSGSTVMVYVPTWGPSGVVMRTMLPAGASHAFPDRIGMVNSWIKTRGADWIVAYAVWSTVNGEPALGRYAGTGLGMGCLACRRSAGVASMPGGFIVGDVELMAVCLGGWVFGRCPDNVGLFDRWGLMFAEGV